MGASDHSSAASLRAVESVVYREELCGFQDEQRA